MTFEYRQGAGAWGAICVDTTETYSCTADSTQVPDGNYELRITATDTLGHSSASAPVTVTVDNTAQPGLTCRPPAPGTPVPSTRATALRSPGPSRWRPSRSRPAGTGTSQAIQVRVKNKVWGTTDTLDLYNSTGATRLNVMSASTQALRLQAELGDGDRELQRDDGDDGQHRHGHDRHAA